MEDTKDKARRNLVVFSALVIFAWVIGLDTSHDQIIKLLLPKIEFRSPGKSGLALALIWAYLFYRFVASFFSGEKSQQNSQYDELKSFVDATYSSVKNKFVFDQFLISLDETWLKLPFRFGHQSLLELTQASHELIKQDFSISALAKEHEAEVTVQSFIQFTKNIYISKIQLKMDATGKGFNFINNLNKLMSSNPENGREVHDTKICNYFISLTFEAKLSKIDKFLAKIKTFSVLIMSWEFSETITAIMIALAGSAMLISHFSAPILPFALAYSYAIINLWSNEKLIGNAKKIKSLDNKGVTYQ